MVKMPEEVVENIKTYETQNIREEMKTAAFSTVDDRGVPNVVPVAFVIVKDAETILIGDNWFKKTAGNLKKQNSNVAVSIWDKKGGYQIKGYANYMINGSDYEMMKEKIKSVSEKLPAKGCVIIKVTEVYRILAGPTGGDKLT
ncbi:MAG TPA: pyridoxamine 5'-phosphate oxidase family protein [Candidatus Acidoferrum sp.]|nr:pyridoxamine 5'-phosphate oxidase family protein [Candidatus Acidoferrum sp.]